MKMAPPTVALVVDRAERTGAYRPYILQYLKKRGFRIRVIIFDRELTGCRFEGEPGEILSLGLNRQDYRKLSFRLARRLRTTLAREGVQVVWVQKYRPALMLALIRGRNSFPRILFHVVNVHLFRGWSRRLGLQILKRQVDCWVPNSYGVKEELQSLGVSEKRLRIIFNGVDPGRFSLKVDRREARRRFELPEEGFLVGMVARFREEKDQEGLLQSFAQFLQSGAKEAFLILAGGGPKKERLARMIAEMGLKERAFLWDRVPPEEVPYLLRALDVFAHPTWREGMPNAVLEAMASGLPVVATQAPGLPEIFDTPRRFGYLVPCGDPSALAQALEELYRLSPSERERWGQEARRRIEEAFTIERMAREFQEVFSSLTGGPP